MGRKICRDKVLGKCSKKEKDCELSHELRNYPCRNSVCLGNCRGKCGRMHDPRKIYSMSQLRIAFFEDNYDFIKRALKNRNLNPKLKNGI